MRIIYGLVALGFLAFWQTTDYPYSGWFSDDQWRLLGYGLLTAAGLLLLRAMRLRE